VPFFNLVNNNSVVEIFQPFAVVYYSYTVGWLVDWLIHKIFLSFASLFVCVCVCMSLIARNKVIVAISILVCVLL